MKISYGITVHNEADELNKLLEVLLDGIDEEDEVVICVDGNNESVKNVIDKYSIDSRVIDYNRKLDGNFNGNSADEFVRNFGENSGSDSIIL